MKPEEINRRCAEFMGWTFLSDMFEDAPCYIDSEGNVIRRADGYSGFNPSENISDAWMLVEKATEIMLGGDLQVRPKIYYNGVGKEWYCMFDGTVISEHHKSAPTAICKAVLKLEESNG